MSISRHRGATDELKRDHGVRLASAVDRVLRQSPVHRGIALMYHRVGDPAGDPRYDLAPSHGLRLFEDQLAYVARQYRVVPASELPSAVRERPRGGRFPLAITFDDDLPSHRAVAMPALRRAGLTATFFLCGASLEAPFSFWFERLQTAMDRRLPIASALPSAFQSGGDPPPREEIHEIALSIQRASPEERDATAERLLALVGPEPEEAGMRAADLQDLAEAGFEIGFHTRRHDYLPSLDPDPLLRALTEGRSDIERITGRTLTTLAYPHGGAGRGVAEGARKAGFAVGFTTNISAVHARSHPLLLGRIEPSFRSTGHLALQLVRELLARPSH